jgi:hypothetical protein
MKIRMLLTLAVGAAAAVAAEFLINGDFERTLTTGWSAAHGSGTYTIDADSFYEPDRDNEAYVQKYDADFARLEQAAPVPGSNLFFGYSVRLQAIAYNPETPYWAAAALVLYYQDDSGHVLGETRLAATTANCPWFSDSVVHVISVPDTNWNRGTIDLRQELDSLPGVNPDSIRRIAVVVLDTTDGCAEGHCEARAIVDDLTLRDTIVPDVVCIHYDVPDGGNGILDPGETADLAVKVRNSGPPLRELSASAISLSPHLSIIDNVGRWGDVAPGDTANCLADRFRVSVDSAAGVGAVVRVLLTFYDSAGVVDTARISIAVGDSVLLPTGPDPYGYYAFDNDDSLFGAHRPFSWVEIEGAGVRITLSDDQTVTVDLPPAFGPIRYYGLPYDEFSVCSNGWLAPGSTDLHNYSNSGLPSPGAPPNIVAVNWDDLYPQSGGGVWFLADTVNHWLVVEWDSVQYYGRAVFDKFEAVVFDQTAPTPTGDNLIVCQYLTGNGYLSSTFGMQDGDGDVGLQYALNGRYPATSARVASGRAVTYATQVPTAVADAAAGGARSPALRVWPVPFHELLHVYTAEAGPGRTCVVCDESGRMVRELACPAADATSWDGTDSEGRQAGAGVYFVVVNDGRVTRSAKVVRVP